MMKRECLIVACAATLAGCGVAADTGATGGASPRYGVLNWCGSCGPEVPEMPEMPDEPVEAPPEVAYPAPTENPPATPAPTEGPPATPAPTPCAAPTAAPAEAVTVIVKDFEFVPGNLTIAPGTTVTWKFEGPAPHTSTSSAGASVRWDSGTKQAGESFSFTFDAAGTHYYHCTLHPRMQGRVTVSEPGGGNTGNDGASTRSGGGH
ncbi:MAG: plastocyanin/azurin family copper-binding protein [Candidatus Sericytochromatia bacterium]